MSSRLGSGAGSRGETFAHHVLVPLFEGGEAGRRRAALIFLCTLGPVSLTVTTLLAERSRPALAVGRFALLAIAVAWLLLRPVATRAEWLVVISLIALANVGGQLLVGAQHSGVTALNSVVIFVIVCVVFDSTTILFSGVAFSTAYLAVQLHYGSPGTAVAAEVLYVTSLVLVALTVHGTAIYLRDAVRRTNELHEEMDRTAELERARIAGELHDDTIQVLTAAALQLDDLGRRLEQAGLPEAAQARRLRELLGQALERTRRLTFELYPATLDQRGLEPSLQVLAEQVSAEASFEVELAVDAEILPGPVAQLAYRTIKELLANASKHADASRVDVSVRAKDGILAAEVRDDGRGFQQEHLARARQGFHLGLDSTRDRVQAAGGTFGIASAPGEGTRAWFTLPLEPTGAGRRPAA
jgi:signal transduction histidine kinase